MTREDLVTTVTSDDRCAGGAVIGLLHSDANNIAPFRRALAAEIADGSFEVRFAEILDVDLLHLAADPATAASVDDRVAEHFRELMAREATAIIVTSATVARIVREVPCAVPVIGIDQVLALEAMRSGESITILSTILGSLDAISSAIYEAIADTGRSVEIVPVYAIELAALLRHGQADEWTDGVVALAQHYLTVGGVIVLAQASMDSAAVELSYLGPLLVTGPAPAIAEALARRAKPLALPS